MKIIQKRIYEGPNIYSHKKCIRIDVDLEGYCEIPSKEIENFNFNLVNIIPSLKDHRCGIDEEGGFIKRLEEGTYLAHICEHIIIAIQNNLGIDVSYGKSREIENDLYYIIIQYEYKRTAIESIRLAIDLINNLIKNTPINFEGRMTRIKEVLRIEEMGPSTKAICEAARKYNLPVTQLGETGFYQIGYGKMGRVIEATIGTETSCVGCDISCDKFLTKELLRNQNIPVACGDKVTNVIELLQCAEKIGYPVVLKPQYGNKGNGVIVNITDEKHLIFTYNLLKKKYEDIILEKYIKGRDYRVCVVDYKVVAVSLRIVPFVIGDGKNNVKELIRIENENPLRGEDHEKPLTKIKLDQELLSCIGRNKITLNYIPKEGEKIELRQNANLSTGGLAVDCTDKICKENIDYCIRAAKTIGLDICGIDICTDDISKPLNESNGIVMEVNAAPGIRMHHYPSKGESRNVGMSILNKLYNNKPCNIPIISVTGTNGKTTTTRLISNILRKKGYTVGMTSTDGIYLNDECIHKGDDSGFSSARTVLLNKDVDVAVLESARGGLIRKGLAYDKADVAVITNITNDHLGIDGINNLEELSFVKALVGEAVKDNGYVVINADDEYSRFIIKRIKAKKIYFSKDENNELIQKNINENGICVFLRGDTIYAVNNKREYEIIKLKNMPICLDGILTYNIENAMAACAALIGVEVDYCMISKGLSEFNLNDIDNRGRFNIYKWFGRTIILDYGHNIEGYRAVLSALSKLDKTNMLIGVIGVPGDRSNDAIEAIGRICAEKLNSIIIKEDNDRRGRQSGEIANILEKSILNFNKHKNVSICLNEVEALKYAMDISSKGDTIVVFYEELEKLIDVIQSYKISESLKVNFNNF